MKTIKQKQLAFLKEMISFYNDNNRGLDACGNCSYLGGCAIGRHIADKELCGKLDGLAANTVSSVFEEIPDNLKELGKTFLTRIQRLHDTEINWCESGLTLIGNDNVLKIKRDIRTGKFLSE